MKKYRSISALAIAACLLTAPTFANAESIEDKINAQNQKIADLEAQGADAKSELTAIQAEVTQIESDIQNVLTEKTTEEKLLSELTIKIEELKVKIAKREEQIMSQARDVQTSHTAGSFIDVVLSARSINDAISKTIALNTLVNANQSIMEAQINDQTELENLQTEAENRLVVINQKTDELQQKQQSLVEARLTQEVKINELGARLATEESQKQAYEQEKVEAEKRRQEEIDRKAAEKAAQDKLNAEKGPENNGAGGNNTPAPVPNTPIPSPGGGGSSSATAWAWPLSSLSVTSPFGNRQNPVGPGIEHHNGIDFSGYSGMPVMASRGGTVLSASYNGGAGNCVIIQHPDGYYSYYMHLSSFSVSAGAQVSAGQQIGGMGTTGSSTGVHLHFGVSTSHWGGYVNPAPLLGI